MNLFKKMLVIFLVLGLISLPSLAYAQNNKESIQLYVNEKPTDKIRDGVCSISRVYSTNGVPSELLRGRSRDLS